MPFNKPITRQKRHKQLGEIRLGTSGARGPVKLDTFRFTTKGQTIANRVAEYFGVEAKFVTLANKVETWEILTTVKELPVIIPPGEAVIDQFFRMYSAAGCLRKCDGLIEEISGEKCKCPADIMERKELAAKGQACKPNTIVRVILPDLAGIGVWKIASNGDNAAVELGDVAQQLADAAARDIYLPAVLRVDSREVKVVGQPVRKFSVPVIDMVNSPREIASGMTGTMSAALESASLLALSASQTAIGPAPTQPQREVVSEESDQPPALVDLKPFIMNQLTSDESEKLRKAWSSDLGYRFKASDVPSSKADEVRQAILSFKASSEQQVAIGDDDDIVDAEIVEEHNDPTGPPGAASWVELLQNTFRARKITGPKRWQMVFDVTGMEVSSWDQVTEWMAEEVVKELPASVAS